MVLSSPTVPSLPQDLTTSLGEAMNFNATAQTISDSGALRPQDTTSESSEIPDKSFSETVLAYASLPAIVFISILGFAGIDMGFDVTVSLSRALILENVPKFQHMRVLVLASIVQSFAGTTCSAIGCFDLPGFLGSAFQTDGTAATLVFFCCILLSASIIGFILMSLASYRLGRRKINRASSSASLLIPQTNSTSQFPGSSSSFNANISQSEDSEMEKVRPLVSRQREVKRKLPVGHLEQLQEEGSYVPDILHTEEGDTSTKPLLLEDSLKVHYSAINPTTAPLTEDHPERQLLRVQSESRVGDSNNTPAGSFDVSSDVEKPSEISLSAPLRSTTQHKTFDSAGVSTVLNTIRQSYSMSLSQRGGLGDFHARKLSQLRAAQSKVSAREKEAARRQLRTRLIVLCISSFFAIGASISFSVYSSNALNLGILHGDPTALPGTQGRANYEQGLRMGAIGNFIMYVSFLCVSLNNSRIIETIGE